MEHKGIMLCSQHVAPCPCVEPDEPAQSIPAQATRSFVKDHFSFYVINFRAYDQYSIADQTYAQYCRLCSYLVCSSSPRHVSASNYAIIKGAI
jgi:hypothetical protein